MDVFADLKSALTLYDEWPTAEKRATLIEAARRFVRAVDQRAEVIEHYRQHVTPSAEALRALLPDLT
jgi:hypothetical protein